MNKILNKQLRKNRVRAKIIGTAERPRLSVFISNTHISAQLIDDETGKTLASATSVGKKLTGTMTEKTAIIGKEIATKAKKAKITKVVFDRNGRKYAGRLKALAEVARAEGLEF
ncbi:MAG: 50S ribosomal protein L18 [Candidatus Nomurabacteria bacterium]|jgi:large subunit ribosomal protein L18|nr:50S ribosomal protein L18 [Candidatus Nomurabacteria bacterium]